MLKWLRGYSRVILVATLLLAVSVQPIASASPFGQGLFGADVPFGSGTSLTIALGGNVAMSMSPSGNNFVGSGSHVITVTSTDVVGYRLYIYSPTSANMTNGAETIPASANSSLAPLAINTWGYNTNGTTNYLGVTTAPVVLKDATGPFKSGDNTTVTYGIYAGPTKGAGQYSVSVVYTAVAKSE